MGHFNCCAVVPVYNHVEHLENVVAALLHKQMPVILVDDGSGVECAAIIQAISKRDNVYDFAHTINQGKGAAVKSGIKFAKSLGYSHALQVDADGQHNLNDIEVFIRAAEADPTTLIAGYPVYDKTVPKHRFYARYLTHVWIWINTLSRTIVDSMCGFRVYPLTDALAVINTSRMGDRMDFDSEFIVRWYWAGHGITQLPTKVIYHDEGVSHFKLYTDNALISLMHARLFCGMLLRIPKLIQLRRSRHG